MRGCWWHWQTYQRSEVHFPNVQLEQRSVLVGVDGDDQRHTVLILKLSLGQLFPEFPIGRSNESKAPHASVTHLLYQ